MKIAVTVKPAQLGKRYQQLAKQRPREVATGIRRASSLLLLELRKQTATKKKIDMRGILFGWRVNLTPTSAEFGNIQPYHRFVELGRNPGGAMPPVALIEAWARRKLGKKGKGAGWAIARAIARRGVKAVPIVTSPGFVDGVISMMAREIDRALSQSLRKVAK